ncbi:hypothetical protein B0T25DRAFT_174358 [Lasiosphaeria hispida]|uniref:Uncharacterized protein n=1 Tax=Lasiosphaeria hispida TaxID=260671 RepID=A0AAJ0HNN1_9PEZI|nr:hypothetical protein B0T25DRAFT_174358 [Lasiosphaeria hispida]
MEEIALFALPLTVAEGRESLVSGKATMSDTVSLSDTSERGSGSQDSDANDGFVDPYPPRSNPPHTDPPSTDPSGTNPLDTTVPQGSRIQIAEDFKTPLAKKEDEYSLRKGITSHWDSGVKHDSRQLGIALIGITGGRKIGIRQRRIGQR